MNYNMTSIKTYSLHLVAVVRIKVTIWYLML